ncbi:hypothetical protein [Gordonia sp. SL306]|uniref:hypothetical protein n=1 Tax=Gordonia sp. SL306 TaxID=2995145 RepID=UPI00226DD8EE|nr:hypothetical protein [Gordonia sp. SL306]WAC57289.1 hypothetical protein OVA31_08665 [Gordonia sp. SL306]
MRKLVVLIAAGGLVAAGSGVTMLVVDASPTSAAPSVTRSSCGQFQGSGPAPDCGVRVSDRTVRVELRNNGIRPVPVFCTLGRVGPQPPTATTTLGPGQRGVLSATSAVSGAQSYVVDCQSAVPVGKEVARRAVFTATFSSPDRAIPKRSTSTRARPSARPRSTVTPTVTSKRTPTVTRSRPVLPRPLLPRPHTPTTTTTTTTPPVG